MKKLFFVLTVTLLTLTLHAQEKAPGAPHLLKHYYELKDALVNSDAGTAFYKITDVVNAGAGKLSASLQKKLTDAGKDLEKQRTAFAGLSLELYGLAKKEKLSTDPIYQAYCPMKKMYWLSPEQTIKNPYYGKMMLNCGSITETIKP